VKVFGGSKEEKGKRGEGRKRPNLDKKSQTFPEGGVFGETLTKKREEGKGIH